MGIIEDTYFEHIIIDHESPENPHIKAVGDINGDGIAETVVASSNGGPLVWYEYPGWKRHVIAPSGKWSCYARVVDMNGDGHPDILISQWYAHDRMEWYENPLPDGDLNSQWELHIIESPRAHDICVGDVDGDGELEIVTRDQGKKGNEIRILKRSSMDSWNSAIIPCPTGEGLDIADIDDDGRMEIIVGGRWYKASGDILTDHWKEHIFADWHEDAVVKMADMDGDGSIDVVLTRSEGPYRISWFKIPADPVNERWVEHIIGDDIDFAHSLAVCDMTGDGNLDVITAEMHQSSRRRVMVYFNEGDALKWSRRVIAKTGSHNICVADLDGDGRPDILGANWSGGYQPVEVWRNLSKEAKKQ